MILLRIILLFLHRKFVELIQIKSRAAGKNLISQQSGNFLGNTGHHYDKIEIWYLYFLCEDYAFVGFLYAFSVFL